MIVWECGDKSANQSKCQTPGDFLLLKKLARYLLQLDIGIYSKQDRRLGFFIQKL